jgi:hypothetical protein
LVVSSHPNTKKYKYPHTILFNDTYINFYKEYLEQSCIENLITDSPNLYGKINYPEFIDHRHDQSIYSVNIKKRKLKTFRSPAQWGIGFENLYIISKWIKNLKKTMNCKNSMFSCKLCQENNQSL